MYLTLLSLAVTIAVVGTALALGAGWLLSAILGLLALIATWLVGARRIQRKVTPALQQVQRQVEARQLRPAVATLRALLPAGRWIPLLQGQLYAQMGILAYHSGDPKEARGYAEKAGRRSAEAQMLLAALRHRDGQTDEAIAGLRVAAPLQRRNVLLHNFRAWLLAKQGRTDEAIATLNRLLKKVPENAATRDNLLRLQNGRKLNMKPFGLEWYAFGLERPPATMGELQPARKGFRQARKQRKRG